MFSDMTLGAKIFWCVFCLTYVATIWLCSPVVIIRTIVWVAVTFIRMFRRNLNEIRSRRDEQPS